MSINQALILTLNCRSETDRVGAFRSSTQISTATALAKLLSPVGKVITPMTAILIQGFLFSFGVLLFGKNILGVLFGSLALSLWGFVQGLIIPYLLFGLPLFQSISSLWELFSNAMKLPFESLYWILAGGVLFKVLATVSVTAYGWIREAPFEKEYLERLERYKVPSPRRTRSRFLQPWFVLSLAITGITLWLNGQNSPSAIVLSFARPIVLGIFFWYLARLIKQAGALHSSD